MPRYTIHAGYLDSTLRAAGAAHPYETLDDALRALARAAGHDASEYVTVEGDGGTTEIVYRDQDAADADPNGTHGGIATIEIADEYDPRRPPSRRRPQTASRNHGRRSQALAENSANSDECPRGRRA